MPLTPLGYIAFYLIDRRRSPCAAIRLGVRDWRDEHHARRG